MSYPAGKSTNYARTQVRSAPLYEPFGRGLAVRYFGQKAIDGLPKFQRGRHAGHPKGHLHWEKTVHGGWVYGAVAAAGRTVWAFIAEHPGGAREHAMCGFWHGRVQPLSGHRDVLGLRGEMRHAIEQASYDLDRLNQIAERCAMLDAYAEAIPYMAEMTPVQLDALMLIVRGGKRVAKAAR